MLTTVLKGTQVDFQTAIIYNSSSNTQSYEHLYLVRNVIVGSDVSTESESIVVEDPCIPNPCYNGGMCALGFGYSVVCYCPNSYSGKCIYLYISWKKLIEIKCSGDKCESYIVTTTPPCTYCAAQEQELKEAENQVNSALLEAKRTADIARNEALVALEKLRDVQQLALELSKAEEDLVTKSENFALAQASLEAKGHLLDMANELAQLTLNAHTMAAQITKSLNDAKLQALVSKTAANLNKEAQQLADQKFADYYKLKLCYPNPCLNSGMCTVGYQLTNYTCFCSSIFIGSKCENLKGESLFSTYKALNSVEKMIRINNSPQVWVL